MTTFVAFLHAVNVGGTGKLLMSDLRQMAEDLGFTDVKTYIASGNLVFVSDQSAKAAIAALEAKLFDYAGKHVAVVVRTHSELKKVLDACPFAEQDPKKTVAIFLDKKPPLDTTGAPELVSGQVDEEIQLGAKEIYVYYASGIGRSKLKFAAEIGGTARNINTIRKMVELSA